MSLLVRRRLAQEGPRTFAESLRKLLASLPDHIVEVERRPRVTGVCDGVAAGSGGVPPIAFR